MILIFLAIYVFALIITLFRLKWSQPQINKKRAKIWGIIGYGAVNKFYWYYFFDLTG